MIEDINSSYLDDQNHPLFDILTKNTAIRPVSCISPFVLSSELEKCLDSNFTTTVDEFNADFSMRVTNLNNFGSAIHKLKIFPEKCDMSESLSFQYDPIASTKEQLAFESQKTASDEQNDSGFYFVAEEVTVSDNIAPQQPGVHPSSSILSGPLPKRSLGPLSVRNSFIEAKQLKINIINQDQIKRTILALELKKLTLPGKSTDLSAISSRDMDIEDTIKTGPTDIPQLWKGYTEGILQLLFD